MPATKVDLDIVEAVLNENIEDSRTIAKIIEMLKKGQEEADEADAADKEPTVKKKFAFLVSDPNGELEGKDLVGWVLQIPEEENEATAADRLIAAAYDYNVTKKGRKNPASTIAEVCEFVPPKLLKEQQVWVKTKEPVLLIRTDNIVPMEKTDKKIRRGRGEEDES